MIADNRTMDRPVIPRKSPGRRWATFGAAGVAILAGAAALYPSVRRWAQSEISVDRSRIRVGTVTRGDLVRSVSVEGRSVAAFHPTVYSPSAGIVSVSVRAGDVVAVGQTLGRVESPELRSRLLQQRSRLRSLEAELERQRIETKRAQLREEQRIRLLTVRLETAIRAMARAEKSHTLGVVNAVEYEQAQDNVQLAKVELEFEGKSAALAEESLAFEVTERKAQFESERLVVEDLERRFAALTVGSPVAGLVSRLHVEDREAVDQSGPLFTVVDLSAFELEVDVPESYADETGPGTEATVTVNGEPHRGRVRSISPEVQGGRVKAIVAFVEAPPQALKQNQRLPTRLLLETRTDVLKVPRGGFLQNTGGRQAYVIEDGVAVLRSIEVGSRSAAEVEIVSGLSVGEQIVVSDTTSFEGAVRVLLR